MSNKTAYVRGEGARIGKRRIIIVSACLLVLCIGAVVAKYIHLLGEPKDTVTAKAFYFESSLLNGETHTFPATKSDNTADISFSIKNHTDALRYSEVDIEYAVTVYCVTDGCDLTLDGSNSSGVSGTISKNSCGDATVTLKKLEAGKTYLVTATTENSYYASISGTVKISGSEVSLFASLADKGEFIELTVWTEKFIDGAYTLSWCGGLIPDSINSTLPLPDTYSESVYAAGELAVSCVGEYCSYVYRFYKTDLSAVYTFEVDADDDTVVISAAS